MGVWRCGDCGATYPKSVDFCTRPFDDYLALRGGSIESAIQLAVDRAIEPLVSAANDRLNGVTRWWTAAGAFGWTWQR